MPIVYILKCADGSFYVGKTADFARRLAAHSAGEGSNYTSKRLPVFAVYTENVDDNVAAVRRERQIKRWTHAKKAALVEGDRLKLKQLSGSRSRRRQRRLEPQADRR